MQKGRLKAKMPTLPPGGGEGISQEFLGNLAAVPGITLVKLTGDSAIEGLRDQILQTGPGRRKDGVKTGASDSAWLRDVLRKAGGNFESVVLLSSDRDVVAACRELRVNPPRMLNIHDLNKTLFRFVSGPEGLSRRIALHFTKLISDLRANTYDGWVEPDIDLGHFDADPSFLLEDLQGAQFQVHGVTLRHLHEVLSVTDIGTASDLDEECGEGESGVLRDLTLDAVVEFRADVDVSIYDIDADGEIQMDVHSLYDVRIIASLLIEISKGVISYCTPLANSRIEALEKPQRLEPSLTPWPAGPVFK
ncbi:hypothetical protein [Streptomyces nymphaeiformis]|uniref:Uncharacterized protein n=1 Tax=Streptomyces nymphaeiformis TaxID=2663842 RepID=A0A7W7XBZ3_9ACTN|nr:hypothetical protein [Streptomyces nymphaeiformis]MBB4982520.1 hypothetical protein [Streptomyces nymphaeiformis]